MPQFDDYKKGDILKAKTVVDLIAEVKRLGKITGGSGIRVTRNSMGVQVSLSSEVVGVAYATFTAHSGGGSYPVIGDDCTIFPAKIYDAITFDDDASAACDGALTLDTPETEVMVYNLTETYIEEDWKALIYLINGKWYAKEPQAAWVLVEFPSALLSTDTSKAGCVVDRYWAGNTPGSTVTVENWASWEASEGSRGLATWDDQSGVYVLVNVACIT